VTYSRSWAEVALDTPILWAKICVSEHHSLDKARRKLARSKSCPLDITINFGRRSESKVGVTEQVIHAMDLIRPALWRTKYFVLSVPSRPQAHAALARCQEDAPLLEVLSINIFNDVAIQEDRHSTYPQLPLFNGHTPRLISCSFTSFNFGWDIRLLNRLRVLRLSGYFNGFMPSPTVLLHILRNCPDMEEIALRNMTGVDSEPRCAPSSEDYFPAQTAKILTLPRLRSISFHCSGVALARQILSQIYFPNLQNFELRYMETVTSLLQILYDRAITKLPLQSLRIESSYFSELEFLKLLRKLPSLSALELVDLDDVSSSLFMVRISL
jgi:hypothetical protein